MNMRGRDNRAGGWTAFNVGGGDDFAKEAQATAKNEKLMEHLATRRNTGKRVPLREVKRQLRLR